MIIETLKDIVLQACNSAFKHSEITREMVELTPPKHKGFGDYASNIAMRLAKPLSKSPLAIAEALKEELQQSSVIASIEIAQPGFLNIAVDEQYLLEMLQSDTTFAPLTIGEGKKVLFEYVSLNVAKPMHVGHLTNAIFGEAVKRMMMFCGYSLTTDDHVGDWGTQFGKLIVAIDLWGDRQQIVLNPMEEFLSLYVKFHDEAGHDESLIEQARDMNKRLEDKDALALEKWQWIVDTNRPYIDAVLEDVGVHFDTHLGESFYLDMMPSIVEELVQKGIATKNHDGSIAVVFEDHGIALPSCLVEKSNGGSLYITRDLATVKYRLEEYSPDMIFYVVGADQILHFKQLFAIVELLGWNKTTSLFHFPYGMSRLPEGSFSTRKGRVVTAQDVLSEAMKRAEVMLHERNPEKRIDPVLQKQLAYGAVSYFYLSQNRVADFEFEWDKVITFEGNSAPYMQYVHARCHSLLEKAGENDDDGMPMIDGECQLTAYDHALVLKLIQFQETVASVMVDYRQNYLTTYLHELSQVFNSFYAHCQVASEENEQLRRARLWMVMRTKQVIAKGLHLLNIGAPEVM